MKKTLLVIAMSTVLAACGSSGSGMSGKVVDKPTNQVSGKKDNIKKDDVKKDNVKKDDVKKDDVKKDDVKKDITSMLLFNKVAKTDNIDKIIINGKTINIPAEDDDGTIKRKNGTIVRAVSGTEYKYVRFGFNDWNDEDKTEVTDVFVQGYVTPLEEMKKLPSDKEMTYTGKASGISHDEKKWILGDSELTVKLGKEKIVKGKLFNWKDSKMSDVSFKANVTGNKFEGNGAKGYFFGKDAAEIGGVYQSDKLAASFGAKK